MVAKDASLFHACLTLCDVLALPILSLVYPLYASIRAIETKSPLDDKQWLTYWILYSFLTIFELTLSRVLEWIPIWNYVKLVFIVWLVLPYFNGAAYVYDNCVKRLSSRQTVNVWYVPARKGGDGEGVDVYNKLVD